VAKCFDAKMFVPVGVSARNKLFPRSWMSLRRDRRIIENQYLGETRRCLEFFIDLVYHGGKPNSLVSKDKFIESKVF
jgi:hypothetical protein